MRSLRGACWLSLACVVLSPTVLAAPRGATLPLTRVRLYETGVGYFERSGALPKGGAALPLPAGHLDDALKTLVVLGGDVKVNGVTFSSSVSRDMAKKLAGLPEGTDVPLGFAELARTFKGAAVTLATSSGSLTGRLVDVLEPEQGALERCAKEEETTVAAPCRLIHRGSLVLLTTAGELRSVPTSEVTALKPTELAARARLDAALDALSQRGAQTRRELAVTASGSGKVTLGYVAEAPVWRSTYRIVLAPDQSRLQGWALLHNDTDEDWRSVQVDLVNGRPTSFLYPLAAPRYARRELVTPGDDLPSMPQLFDTTVDNLWGGEGLSLSAMSESGGGRGEGVGLGNIGTLGRGVGYGEAIEAPSEELDIGNLAALAPAQGVEAAALFRYSLPSKLALAAHASALLPFLDSAISARQICWFPAGADVASSALHLTNDTAQTLPAGTLSVFGDGGFAGEAILPRTQPRASHVLAYGLDLDVQLTRESSSRGEEPKLFDFEQDRLVEHYVRRRSETLSLHNRSRTPRRVYVELDVIDNARIEGAPQLGRNGDTKQTYVVLEVGAAAQLGQTLRIEEALQRRHAFGELSSATLRAHARYPLAAAQRAVLSRAADLLHAAEIRLGAEPKRRAELEQSLADIARLRENARILSAADAPRAKAMSARLVELESRVTLLRRRVAELTSEAQGLRQNARRELFKL
jgi:hypothetical protein